MSGQTRHVIIVGAGLSGCLLAIYLARRGFRVDVYERRPDPREDGPPQGRSINLALSARGLWGLAGAGLDLEVLRKEAVPMRGRVLHDPAGKLAFQPYSKNPGDAINSVSRAGLNLRLLHAAASMPGVAFHFGQWCEDVDLDAPAVLLRSHNSSTLTPVRAEVVLGADGAFSPVRGRLQKTDRFELSQSYLAHGYKELHIPPVQDGPRGPFAMEPNALHIWPRGSTMMIALPNQDGSFTCTLFWPFEGDHSFASLPASTPGGTVRSFFQANYPDAAALMPTLEHDYAHNPAGSLVTIRCGPWHHQGKVGILGDAAHAVVPFYGQGMNAAFEDVRILANLLDDCRGDFARALPAFDAARRADADAIADMALENFTEMRDLAGRPEFRHLKHVERALHESFGEPMTPQYNLVSFSTTPYSSARARGARITAVAREIARRLPLSHAAGLSEDEFARRVKALAASPEPPLIDISPPLSPATPVWPGDTPLTREVLLDLAKGDTVTLSTLRATVHLGAHADGPSHYGPGGADVASRPLVHYVGPCTVLDAPVAKGARVALRDVTIPQAGLRPRVLIKTATFSPWNSDFAGLSPELIDELARHGVTTVGVDTPSVDLQDSKDLPAHNAIFRHDMSILEGLVLDAVPAGEYELLAQPLRLEGFDASPVRAILRPLEPGA